MLAVALRQRWRDVCFISWPIDPAALANRIPEGLDLDALDGNAWLSIVALRVDSQPGPDGMLQVNVRTYVSAKDGSRGIWLLASYVNRRRLAQAVRAVYRQPYLSAGISTEKNRWTVDREVREPVRAGFEIRPGEWLPGGARTVLDRFLTERFTVYSNAGPAVLRSDIDHPPWPLNRATVAQSGIELIAAERIPRPTAKPVGHCSEGVDVEIGLPRPLG